MKTLRYASSIFRNFDNLIARMNFNAFRLKSEPKTANWSENNHFSYWFYNGKFYFYDAETGAMHQIQYLMVDTAAAASLSFHCTFQTNKRVRSPSAIVAFCSVGEHNQILFASQQRDVATNAHAQITISCNCLKCSPTFFPVYYFVIKRLLFSLGSRRRDQRFSPSNFFVRLARFLRFSWYVNEPIRLWFFVFIFVNFFFSLAAPHWLVFFVRCSGGSGRSNMGPSWNGRVAMDQHENVSVCGRFRCHNHIFKFCNYLSRWRSRQSNSFICNSFTSESCKSVPSRPRTASVLVN